MIRNAVRAGKPIPKKILDAPQVGPNEQFYYDAYIDLNTCRNYEGGPIPWLAIVEYASRFKLSDWHTDLFVMVLQILDAMIRDEQAKERPT